VNAQLVSKDGVIISLIITRQSPTFINDFEILGTEGRLIASPFSEGRWLLDRPNKQPELVQFEHVGPAHTELIAELIPRLQQGQSSPVPGEEAVADWRVIEAIYRACQEGRRVLVGE
jgi:predicted dehydrogenase